MESHRKARGPRSALLLTALFLLGSGLALWPDQPAVRGETAPVLFGASARPRGAEGQREAVEDLEQAIGRNLAAIRVYKRWDHAFPTYYERWLRSSGHTLFLSVASRSGNGQPIPWGELADAPIGSDLHDGLVRWAKRVRDFGDTVYFTFNHEPETENQSVMGGQDDFIAAWRRVVTVFRNHGASNARFTWILTAFTFSRSDGQGPWSWYPGDEFVDVIGADGYNFFGCRAGVADSWRPFSQVFEPVRAFAAAHPGKEAIIGEWGSVEDPAIPGRKAEWIQGAQDTLSAAGWEQFKAALYYHAQSQVGDPPCDFWVDSSQSSLSAFAAMGADPHFYSGGPPQISSISPSTGPVGTAVTVSGLNFSGVQGVAFEGTQAAFTTSGLSSLTATVPPGAAAGPITVTTAFGTTSGPTFGVVHGRAVSFALRKHLVASGEVTVEDGFDRCATRELVRVELRVRGKGWRPVDVTLTRRDGSYRVHMSDRAGKYRVRLPRVTLPSSDVCGKARSQARRN